MLNNWLNQTILENSYESLLWFLLILLLGLLLKRFVSLQFSGLIYSFFKRYAGAVDVKTFQKLLLKPISLFIVLITIYIAFKQLHFPVRWELPSEEKFGLRFIIWKAFQVSLVISLTWTLLRIVDFFGLVLLERVKKTESRSDDQLVPFVKESIKFIIGIFSFFILLGAIFQVNIVSLIAGLGIGGLAVALAARDTLENLIGSFAIFLDKPFTIGDLIKVGNTAGRVEKIGFRSTQIRTFEKTIVIVPNKKIMDAELENVSLRNMIRAVFPLTLRFETSVEQIEIFIQKITGLLGVHEHIETFPAPQVRLSKITDTGIELEVLFFVRTTDPDFYLKVKEEILFRILRIAQELTIRFDARALDLATLKSVN